jgi:hypothetical protein
MAIQKAPPKSAFVTQMEANKAAQKEVKTERQASLQQAAAEAEQKGGWNPKTNTWNTGEKMSKLQEHIGFFDQNHDGHLTISETAKGFEKLGLSPAASLKNATLIHMGMSASTVGWGTALTSGLPIELKNIAAAKHKSDTGVYDAQGNVDPQRFEAMFKAADKDGDGKLTISELADMRAGNKARDQTPGVAGYMRSLFSAFESQGEFGVFMDVAGKADGPKGEKVLTKDQVFKLYNGTLFQEIADQRAAAAKP